jgi:ornithine--oxo-acid transaminase
LQNETLETGQRESYGNFVNPQWARLLDVLSMNVRYERCEGAELITDDGRRIVDFLSGYCVHNTGHNHPRIISVLQDELDRRGPVMLQSHVPESAGALGERLTEKAGGGLKKAFFSSSGSEGVEAAIKFARAHTGRRHLLYAEGAFHGLTCGALSLMGDPFWREGFGPMLPHTASVSFGDIEALERQLNTRQFAMFIVEPIQSEAGIRIPDANYLREAQAVCRRNGTLLVLDEVQTGMHRTGPFLAAHHYGAEPDMVVMAKALSGGLVPVGAVLMTEPIYQSVYGSLKRSIIHTSTFSENALSMRAALATLDVLEQERMGDRAMEKGERLRSRLRETLSGYEMVKEVRGVGLLCGVEFTAPRSLGLRMAFQSFMAIHPAMFGQILVMRLFRDHNVLTQVCGNNHLVLKAAPPLMVSDSQIEHYASALTTVVRQIHESPSFWTEALGLARRVANI